ncbi:MAG: hypothetical protein KH056_02950 [Clostridiales bacterium]|nr:hypothetical protein [Clostridiales bacterium]
MTEQEKQILKNLVEVIPDMDELQRMYLLGQAEGMAFMKKKQSEKTTPVQTRSRTGERSDKNE